LKDGKRRLGRKGMLLSHTLNKLQMKWKKKWDNTESACMCVRHRLPSLWALSRRFSSLVQSLGPGWCPVHSAPLSTLDLSIFTASRLVLHIGCEMTEKVKFTVIHNYREPRLPCQSNKINTFLTEFNNMVL
jgi:hypothetical protein